MEAYRIVRLSRFLDNRLTDDGEVVSPLRPGRCVVVISVADDVFASIMSGRDE
jgi:hypothetical protein